MALCLVLGLHAPALASDFWEEVRTPGLRAYTQLVANARRSFNAAQHTVALGFADEAHALLPTRSEALVVRGRALASMSRLSEAREAFEQALSIRSDALDDSQDAHAAARVAAEAADYALASRILSRAVDREAPGSVRASLYVLLGDVEQCQGREHLRDAVTAYRAGLRTAGSDLRSRAGLALALRRLGERNDAQTALGSVLATGGRVGSAFTAARSFLPASEIAAREALLLETLRDEAGARDAWTRAAVEGPWRSFAEDELRTLATRIHATPAATARPAAVRPSRP